LAAQDGQLACERIINVLEEIMEGRSELPKPALPIGLAAGAGQTDVA